MKSKRMMLALLAGLAPVVCENALGSTLTSAVELPMTITSSEIAQPFTHTFTSKSFINADSSALGMIVSTNTTGIDGYICFGQPTQKVPDVITFTKAGGDPATFNARLTSQAKPRINIAANVLTSTHDAESACLRLTAGESVNVAVAKVRGEVITPGTYQATLVIRGVLD